MRPFLPPVNLADHHVGDGVDLRQPLEKAGRIGLSSDLPNLVLGKLRPVCFFAAGDFFRMNARTGSIAACGILRSGKALAALAKLVIAVVLVRPHKKMRWIHTFWDVAAMANQFPLRYRTDEIFISPSMGNGSSPRMVFPRSNREGSISVSVRSLGSAVC